MSNDKGICQMPLAKHIKTGNIYIVLARNVCECTNGRNDVDGGDLMYTVYMNKEGMVFCREQKEFNQKFEYV